MGNKLERCNSCILPTSANHIDFDDNGTCSLCNSAKQLSVIHQDMLGCEDRLDSEIRKIRERGKGRPFDCVVGVSGGRDSTYLLYLLVHKHNLKCLAAYYRTPFTSDVIDANVKRFVSRLNVPLVKMDISNEFHRRIASELVFLWTKKPLSIIPNLACAPCKLLNREVFKTAVARDVKSIVYGGNIFESVQIAAWQPGNTILASGALAARELALRAQIRKTLSIIEAGIGVMKTSGKFWRYIPIGFQASVMYLNPHTPFLRLRYPHIHTMDYFYHAEYNESQRDDVLLELEWELPPGCNSSWKADCCYAELKNYMLHASMGITYMDAFLSNLVRAGVLSRDEALKRIEVEGKTSQERIAEVCRILELPSELFTSSI
jgi:hypothetical protein